jgi:hypothetical protein
MLLNTARTSTPPLPSREGTTLKKFLHNLPVWRFSTKSPATFDLPTATGIVRLVIVEQGWSGDFAVPDDRLKEAVTVLCTGRLKRAYVVLVDHEWRVRARASVQKVVMRIGFCQPRHGVYWMDSNFKIAVKCFPRPRRNSEAVGCDL